MAENHGRWKPLLRDAEQICAGSILLLSLIAIAVFSYIQQQRGRGVIDLEQPYQRRTIAFQLDINSAEAAELRLLPGVGKTLAERIIASRQTEGSFGSPDDLRRVRGIGPRTLERIKPYLLPIAPTADVVGQ